jgi:hemerythrin
MPSSDKSTPFCSWDEGCRVGIEKLDDQHKGLFLSLNKLYDILMSHGDSSLVHKELTNLAKQTRTHFKTEEQFMLKHGYPGYQMHKVMHGLLLQQLEDVLTLESNDYEQPWIERLEHADFLHAWLVAHILDEDKKIGAFLKIDGAK